MDCAREKDDESRRSSRPRANWRMARTSTQQPEHTLSVGLAKNLYCTHLRSAGNLSVIACFRQLTIWKRRNLLRYIRGMKTWTVFIAAPVLAICTLAQKTEAPQLKLRLVTEKDIYALNERVMVKSELTNLTSKTLCFPVPDQDCETTAIGSIITTADPVKAGEVDRFICHADGGGPSEAQLESEIKNRWIKLAPNAVYTTKFAEAKARLNQLGDWRVRASYHPPVGAFSRDYVTVLQSAAERMGCQLPNSAAVAEPRTITVLPANPDR